MLKTVIEKLIDRLNVHNYNCVTVNDHLCNHGEINMLIEVLESVNVKVSITAKNPTNDETGTFDAHSQSLSHAHWAYWRYIDVRLDVSQLSKVNQPLFGEMAYSEYKWDLKDGLVIFDLMKGF